MLPDGSYVLEVEKADALDHHILIGLRVLDGPHKGRHTTLRLVFTQKAMPIAFANLAGFGIGKDEIGQVSTLQEIADALVGRVVEVPEMTSREYNGRRFQSWPIGGIRSVHASS